VSHRWLQRWSKYSPRRRRQSAFTPRSRNRAKRQQRGAWGVAQRFNTSDGAAASISAQWWMVFHSPELNGMMEQALANSPTLAQATARLREAQEELNARTGATKYPR